MPLDLTRENFDSVVSDGGTVLIDVWSEACAPCVALMPAVEGIERDRPDLTVAKLEAPKNRRLCIDLRLMGLPTFLVFRDGVEVSRISEPNLNSDQLMTWLDDSLGRKEVKA